MKPEASRMKHIDIARGIAMLCIIIGHMDINGINRVVFTFHVPIFFLISGYFISESGELRPFVLKRLRTLIVPYFVTALAMIVIGSVKMLISYGPDEALVTFADRFYGALYGAGDGYEEPFYIRKIGAIWFLWASFWGSLLFRITLKSRPALRPFIIALIFAAGYFTHLLCWFPLSIQAGCCAVLWFYAGYLAKGAKPLTEKLSDEYKYAAFLLAAVVWVFFIIDFRGFWLVNCFFGRGVVDIIGSLCGCYVVIWVSKLLEQMSFIGGRLAFLGKNSIFMLCFHMLELEFIPWTILTRELENNNVPGLLVTLILIALKFVLVISLTAAAARSGFMRKLFGTAL